MSRTPVVSQHVTAQNDLEALALRAVQAFNERDFTAALKFAHPEIVAFPTRVHGISGALQGHAGMVEWARRVAGHALDIEILLSSMRTVERRSEDRRDSADEDAGPPRIEQRVGHRRHLNAAKLALFGDICLQGEPLNPWAALLTVQDGLVIRLRTYLSSSDLLEHIGVLAEPVTRAELAS